MPLIAIILVIFGSLIWKAYRPARATAPAPAPSELDAEVQPRESLGELEAQLAKAQITGVGELADTSQTLEQPHVHTSHDGANDERTRGAPHHASSSLRAIVAPAGHVPLSSHLSPKAVPLGPKKGAGVRHSNTVGNERTPILHRRRPHRSPSSGDYGTMGQNRALSSPIESTISNFVGEDGEVTRLGEVSSYDGDDVFFEDTPSGRYESPCGGDAAAAAAAPGDDAPSGLRIPTAGDINRQSGEECPTEIKCSSVETQFRWKDQDNFL